MSRDDIVIRVEGVTDAFAIGGLLLATQHVAEDKDLRHKSARSHRTTLVYRDNSTEQPLLVVEAGGNRAVLDAVNEAIQARPNRLAFVIDADESVESAWQSLRDRLVNTSLSKGRQPLQWDPPIAIAPERNGYVGIARDGSFSLPVAFWIMPDNLSNGAIEQFLFRLASNHMLKTWSKIATGIAKFRGGSFSPNDRSKAEMKTWLAWHETPGASILVAFRDRYFDTSSDAACRFVEWYRRFVTSGGPP